jgi:hypothetical protein
MTLAPDTPIPIPKLMIAAVLYCLYCVHCTPLVIFLIDVIFAFASFVFCYAMCNVHNDCICFDTEKKKGISVPTLSAGAYTTTLYVVVDRVKGGGLAPLPIPGLAEFTIMLEFTPLPLYLYSLVCIFDN